VTFEVVQGSLPDVWKWSVVAGDPRMLRIGKAATEQQDMAQVKQVIDRVRAVEASR
jgi:hypothetical protein